MLAYATSLTQLLDLKCYKSQQSYISTILQQLTRPK